MVQTKKPRIRQKILTAARKEFLKKGFNGTSMRLIAKRSRCTLSNIYNYFHNKDEIYCELVGPVVGKIKWLFDLARKFAPRAGRSIPTVKDKIAGMPMVCDFIEENRDCLKLLFLYSEGSSYASFRDELIYKYSHETFPIILEIFKASHPKKKLHEPCLLFLMNFISFQINSFLKILKYNPEREEMLRFLEEMKIFSYSGFRALLGIPVSERELTHESKYSSRYMRLFNKGEKKDGKPQN
ncbi:TetR/AcrR family transcriptional regulator [Candidatus Riflebacteria bacterium]